MNAEGRNKGWQKWKLQIPGTNLQRSSQAHTSQFAGLVFDHSLELLPSIALSALRYVAEDGLRRMGGCWGLDVTSLISVHSHNIAPFLQKPLIVSPCAPMALKMNYSKLKAKKSPFFPGHLGRESLENQAKILKKVSSKCRNFRGYPGRFLPRPLFIKSPVTTHKNPHCVLSQTHLTCAARLTNKLL
jgi:hypothetical protein